MFDTASTSGFFRFYGQLTEKYFAFCSNYSVVTVHNSHTSPSLFPAMLCCCQPVSLVSRSDHFMLFYVNFFTMYYPVLRSACG